MKRCNACQNNRAPHWTGVPGALLMYRDGVDPEIQKCDECERFATDGAAQVAVVKRARRAARHDVARAYRTSRSADLRAAGYKTRLK